MKDTIINGYQLLNRLSEILKHHERELLRTTDEEKYKSNISFISGFKLVKS